MQILKDPGFLKRDFFLIERFLFTKINHVRFPETSRDKRGADEGIT